MITDDFRAQVQVLPVVLQVERLITGNGGNGLLSSLHLPALSFVTCAGAGGGGAGDSIQIN